MTLSIRATSLIPIGGATPMQGRIAGRRRGLRTSVRAASGEPDPHGDPEHSHQSETNRHATWPCRNRTQCSAWRAILYRLARAQSRADFFLGNGAQSASLAWRRGDLIPSKKLRHDNPEARP